MTDKQDLQRRFENAKNHMVMCIDKYETTEPTDKEVWEFMKSVAELRKEEAMADDMEGYVIEYQKRIQLIDEQIKAL